MREREFIEWICRQGRFDPRATPVGPGDDCAVLTCDGRQILLTTDQVLDGVHFVLADHGPQAVGRKAMARGLSDIAAMAAAPVAAVAAVALPDNFAACDAEAIYAGLREIADRFDCPVVGGDVGVWSGALAINVTIIGRPGGANSDIKPVLRSGAKVGDAICVTGKLGGAWRSRRHLEFLPRVTEAISLAGSYAVSSMIDISDGLAADLHHLCDASDVAARIVAADVPVHSDANLAAALGDGEDYELLFTLPADQARRLCEAQPLPIEVTRIGSIVEGRGATLIGPDGRGKPLERVGWEHETKGGK